MDLFDSANTMDTEPLAARMRPRNLDEYFGQDHIIGKGRLLRRAIKGDQLSSVIFYGPPGTGKTTLARVIAGTTKSLFLSINAVLSGVKQIREAIDEASENRKLYGKRTILFVDEVHRWNKSQQDALLPWVENGTFILIGATTENPYFEVNSALVSRSRVFQLKPLEDKDLYHIAKAAIKDKTRGYGKWDIEFHNDAMDLLVEKSSGDARTLLNALELAIETTPEKFPPPQGERIVVDLKTAEESIQQKAVLYDKEGDYHYDTISAFIKSIRGSDPDAALYWLSRMLLAGESPNFILRRLLISASEDIGLADPNAISVVSSCATSFDRVGMPEGAFFLTQATLYLAVTKKSNTTMAYFDAVKAVEEEKAEVPNHLKDGSRDKHSFGHGAGYKYPHAYRDHWVSQAYLPDSIRGRIFYKPSNQGWEGDFQTSVLEKRESQISLMMEEAPQEVLTYSPGDKERTRWVNRTQGKLKENLGEIKSRVFKNAKLSRHSNILIFGDEGGSLTFEAFKRAPEGYVFSVVSSQESYDILNYYTSTLDSIDKPFFELKPNYSQGTKFETIIIKNKFTKLLNKEFNIKPLLEVLNDSGEIVITQVIPSMSSRISDFIEDNSIKDPLIKCEKWIYKSDNPLINWSKEDLEKDITSNKLKILSNEVVTLNEERLITPELIDNWFKKIYGDALEALDIEISKDTIVKRLIRELAGRKVNWKSHHVVLLSTLT